MSKTFCPIMWNFQAIRNNGDIRMCCQANITKNKGVVRHANGSSYNAGRDSLTEARNAPLMASVRKNMMEGKWSDECERCKREEANGLDSRRTYELLNKELTLEDVLPFTNSDGTIDTTALPVTFYDLRFGNLCNLACRMCGPQDSHTWYEQWTKLTGSPNFEDTHGIVSLTRNEVGRLVTSDYDWHGSESFWVQLESNLQNIRNVYMAGGEPLLIERHYEFLNKCIELDVAKNITLEYNTNGTTLPPRAIEAWTHFKAVHLGVSVDGVGEVVEYQRWPIKWSQLYSNLKKINDLIYKQSNIEAWLAVTVTAYNVHHIPDMIDWEIRTSGLDNFNKFRPILTHHIAHRPESTNIRMLPPEIKQLIETKYNEYCSKILASDLPEKLKVRACQICNSIVSYMNTGDLSEYIKDFIKFTNFLDKERGQNVLDIMPFMSGYFTNE